MSGRTPGASRCASPSTRSAAARASRGRQPGAVLQDAHAHGLTRVVAVAPEDNIGSRRVLGGIGMVEEGQFTQAGRIKLLYASERRGLGKDRL